ncbi:MAG: hypothetical protein A2W35_17995 [Chloroflexi bacterium RBG_16_57_11]|nr:MAG: hypothetical protein A2W35_17995 [Chloroflexi bacterium RBG_16_57_11]
MVECIRRHTWSSWILPAIFAGGFIIVALACRQLSPVVVTVVPITVEPRLVTVEVPYEVTRMITKKQRITQEVTRQTVVEIIQTVEVTRLVPVTLTPFPPSPLPLPTTTPSPTTQLSQGNRLNVPRTLHTATILADGRVLIIGGYTAPNTDTASIEIYNPTDRTFRLSGSLRDARHDHSATHLLDGRVLVIAGYAGYWLSNAELYDPSANVTTRTLPIYSHGVEHTATRLNDGRVLVIAGATRSGSPGPDDRVENFDPRTNNWQRAAPHVDIEGSHTATVLTDGRVLVAGGNADPSIYNPSNDTWQPAGELFTDRWEPMAVQLFDGRVLLAGGRLRTEERVIQSVEIYDPANDTWRQAASTSQPHYRGTMTLLSDGRVLVAGGSRLLDNA